MGMDGIFQLHSLSALLVNLPSTMNDAVMTSRKRSLRRLCFYTCLSVHGGSAPGGCLLPGGACSRGVPAPGAACSEGVCFRGGACSQGGGLLWGVPAPEGANTPPLSEGYCLGRYTSYWNAFLFERNFRSINFHVSQLTCTLGRMSQEGSSRTGI